MSKWDVTLTRTLVEYTSTTVEADTREEAEELACAEENDLDWNLDGGEDCEANEVKELKKGDDADHDAHEDYDTPGKCRCGAPVHWSGTNRWELGNEYTGPWRHVVKPGPWKHGEDLRARGSDTGNYRALVAKRKAKGWPITTKEFSK